MITRDEQIEKLVDVMRDYRLLHTKEEDNEPVGYPLIDALTYDGGTVDIGIEECGELAAELYDSVIASFILEAERRGYAKREEDYNECVKILGAPAESLGPQPPELPEQQDTAQQIEGVCNLLIELGQDSGCRATAERIVLEAERRAEQRVRAEIGSDTERLDWLEKTSSAVLEEGNGGWRVTIGGIEFSCMEETARKAIDAAREVG